MEVVEGFEGEKDCLLEGGLGGLVGGVEVVCV